MHCWPFPVLISECMQLLPLVWQKVSSHVSFPHPGKGAQMFKENSQHSSKETVYLFMEDVMPAFVSVGAGKTYFRKEKKCSTCIWKSVSWIFRCWSHPLLFLSSKQDLTPWQRKYAWFIGCVVPLSHYVCLTRAGRYSLLSHKWLMGQIGSGRINQN